MGVPIGRKIGAIMHMGTLAHIEHEIRALSLCEQVQLMEWLVRHIRQRSMLAGNVADELAEMAADPDIQRELRAIERESVVTEADGLQ